MFPSHDQLQLKEIIEEELLKEGGYRFALDPKIPREVKQAAMELTLVHKLWEDTMTPEKRAEALEHAAKLMGVKD